MLMMRGRRKIGGNPPQRDPELSLWLRSYGNRFVVGNVFSLTFNISCNCLVFLYDQTVAKNLQTYSHLMGSNSHNSFLCDERTHHNSCDQVLQAAAPDL